MTGPMDGVKVVELGVWVAGPACGGILADWGAEVVKIETPDGDPFRSLDWLFDGAGNPPFELDNRGKRSLALDLATSQGIEVLHRLLADADVFITNNRPGGLERLGLDYETLAERYPRLVYASVTGLSLWGEERDRPTYDVGAFWARSGIAAALTPEGNDPPYQRGGMGDHLTGMSAAAGVSAALYHREKTGRGQRVEASLLRLGTYMLGWDHNITALTGRETVPWNRRSAPNPLINAYQCADESWVWLLGLEADRHWPPTLAALEHPEWADDTRFTTIEARLEHSADLVAMIGDVISQRSRDEWATILDHHNVWWAPLQTTLDMQSDPQARAAGCWVEVPTNDGGVVEMVASPIDFSASRWTVREPAPELGQHTELILAELGYDWDTIGEYKEAGVIP